MLRPKLSASHSTATWKPVSAALQVGSLLSASAHRLQCAIFLQASSYLSNGLPAPLVGSCNMHQQPYDQMSCNEIVAVQPFGCGQNAEARSVEPPASVARTVSVIC